MPCGGGYVRFGMCEVANISRTINYINNDGSADINGSGFPGFHLLGPGFQFEGSLAQCECPPQNVDACGNPLGPFLRPDGPGGSDVAPWYTPRDPTSAEFYGALITCVNVRRDQPIRSRTKRQFGLGGSNLGPIRDSGTFIELEGVLVSGSCCGMDYGEAWLRNSLRDCGPCGLDELEILTCCGPLLPGTMADNRAGRWIIYDVGLYEEIEVDRKEIVGDCCLVAPFTITLASENPFLYECPEPCLATQLISPPGPCVDLGVYLYDPTPPVCCQLDPADPFGVTGAIITINSNDQPLDNLVVDLFTPPTSLACPPTLTLPVDCPTTGCREYEQEPCARLTISHLDPFETLTIDSARHQVILESPGGVISDGLRRLVLPPGEAFTYLEAGGCDDLCVCAYFAQHCRASEVADITIDSQRRIA